MDNYQKAQNGDLSRGHNFMWDDVFGGNELLYGLVNVGIGLFQGSEGTGIRDGWAES